MNTQFTAADVQAVRYFANKYRRMAIEHRMRGRGHYAAAESLERQAKDVDFLAGKIQRAVDQQQQARSA